MTQGVISGGHPDTIAAGAAILQQGGNAVDAAVAATFAACVVEVGLVSMGGSGIAQIYDPNAANEAKRSIVYDFFSNMPGLGAADRPGKMDFAKVMIDFGATTQDFHVGRASVAVPGNFFGLCQMAADYGRLSLATLLQPAIQLAQNQFTLDPFQAFACQLLTPIMTYTPDMATIFAAKGTVASGGDRLFIPDLAEMLRELADAGESLLRNGRLAQAVVADQQTNGGLLTATDLASYQVGKMPPIRIPYHGHEVLLPPPSSTGGVLTAFTLKLMNRFNVSQWEHGSAPHLQILYELMATTAEARPVWDKAVESSSTGDELLQAVAAFLDDDFVSGYANRIADNLRQKRPSSPPVEPLGPRNTTHLSVIDANGMMVSLTHSAGETAGYVVPKTGFIPNNMLGEADLHPQGFHTRPAGRRIPTMMTPTVILQNGVPRMAIGSGGSIRIRSAILQTVSNLLDYKMTLQEAVDSPRVHVEDGTLQCEGGYDETAVSQLEALGYPVNRWQDRSMYFGGAHTVSRTANGRLVGAGDKRRAGVTILV
ncbi:MAG: gamma-glutamyltransferase [Chloroflexota bacterium]